MYLFIFLLLNALIVVDDDDDDDETRYAIDTIIRQTSSFRDFFRKSITGVYTLSCRSYYIIIITIATAQSVRWRVPNPLLDLTN